MKRYVFNLALVVCFAAVITAVALSFVAEAEYGNVVHLQATYRWTQAQLKYERAIALNPFNSLYLAKFADFLKNKSAYEKQRGKKSLLRAEKLYKRALRLNTRCAEYAIDLGKLHIKNNRIDEAFQNFKKATKNDPNGFDTIYQIGYIPIAAWRLLDQDEKTLVLDSLMGTLKKRPWYGFEYIYPRLWRYTHDFKILQRVTPANLSANKSLMSFIINYDLGQFYIRQEKVLDFYTKKEMPEKFSRKYLKRQQQLNQLVARNPNGATSIKSEDWIGERQYSGNEYKNGNMYWSGTIFAVVNVPEGNSRIKIKAKGSKARDIWPYMVVGLDEKQIGDVFVNTPEWKEYSFDIKTTGGVKVLSITFPNDGGDETKGEDRNLYIGEAKIDKNVD